MYGDRIQFIDIMTRQAHPGLGAPPYVSSSEKRADAKAFRVQHGIEWPVAVDDLEGTVHQVYGGLSDPSYLIDANGKVAFYNLWTHVPTLFTAFDTLVNRQNGLGIINKGIDKVPHLLAAIVNGWPALQRGYPQSKSDLDNAAFKTGTLIMKVYRVRNILAPLALRDKPLPLGTKIVLWSLAGLTLLVSLPRGRNKQIYVIEKPC